MTSKFNKKSLSYFILIICFTSLIGVVSLSNAKAASSHNFKKPNAALKNTLSAKDNSVTSKANIITKDSNKTLNAVSVENIKYSNTKKCTLNLQGKNSTNVQKKLNISTDNINNKSSNKKINKSTNKKPNTISHKETIGLLSNSYNSMRNLESFYMHHTPFEEFNNHTYMKMPKSITSHKSLVTYLNKTLGLNKYFTNDYTERLIKYVFSKQVNGQYYMFVGQFGQIFDMKAAKITSTKYEGNKLYVTYQGYYEPNDLKTEKATLVFDGTNWLVDTATFSPW